MKFIIILALVGLSVSSPVIPWEHSLFNWFEEATDVRGPNMQCIELNIFQNLQMKQNEIENYGNYMTEKGTEISSKNTKDAVDDARKEIPTIKKMVKSVLGIYDNAVKSCRTDDKFSVTDFVFKFIDLFENLDDDTFKSVVEEISNGSSEEKKDEEKKDDDDSDVDIECFKERVGDVKSCAKQYFSFQIYEEKGICGSSYKKMIDCLEETVQKCVKNVKSEMTIVGSVVFRFMYEVCHP